MKNPVIFLSIPSVLIFVLLSFYLIRNLGKRRALPFLGLTVLYGILRALLLRQVVETERGGLLPYVLMYPILTLGGVPLQEILGWSIAVTLALPRQQLKGRLPKHRSNVVEIELSALSRQGLAPRILDLETPVGK